MHTRHATVTLIAATTRQPDSPTARARYPLTTTGITRARTALAGMTSRARALAAHGPGVARALAARALAVTRAQEARALVVRALVARAQSATRAGRPVGTTDGATSQPAQPAGAAHPSAFLIATHTRTRATRVDQPAGTTRAGKARNGKAPPGMKTAGVPQTTTLTLADTSTPRTKMMCGSQLHSANSALRAEAWRRAWVPRGRMPRHR